MVTAGAVKLVMVAVVRPGSTKVEGRCRPSGWRLPQPWKFTGPHGGAGESRGWPNSREGGPRPGQERNTWKRDAHLVRQGRWTKGAGPISTSMEVSPWMAAKWDVWPVRAVSSTMKSCRAMSVGWPRWPVRAVEAVPVDTSPILLDPQHLAWQWEWCQWGCRSIDCHGRGPWP